MICRRQPPSRSLTRAWRRPLVWGGLLLFVGSPTACEGDPGGPGEGISAETFVAAYVDLRVRALQTPGGEVTPADRDAVLAEHGITQNDLIEFVERHGKDVPTISEVWDSVDARLRQRREALRERADTTR
jgi:hypothetical protein